MAEKLLKNETELLIWKVPKKLKRRFKTACAHKETNMRAQILEFMEQYSFNTEREQAKKRAGLP